MCVCMCAWLCLQVSLTIRKQPSETQHDAGRAATQRPVWAAKLFKRAYITMSLTHLTLPCALEPWLVQMLQQYMPCESQSKHCTRARCASAYGCSRAFTAHRLVCPCTDLYDTRLHGQGFDALSSPL